ncbi:MAG: hypothetical protein H0U55_04670 [Rubrobacteraceae bacterium]|nr:hypothetical protein [Rubrobacteraceae bacterium]
MSRRRRRRGSGSRRPGGRGGSRRTIIITSVGPTGVVNSPNPTIRAIVEDRYGVLLSRDDIDVYIDGEPMRFDYGESSGRLTCPTGGLSSGTHAVEIEAIIETNHGSRTARKRWTFSVARR